MPVIIGVLALQGDVREHLRLLAGCGARACPVRRPGELDGVDGLVVPGGESTTMSKLAIEFGMLEPVRKRIAGGMPAYGSCAGMIMLADRILDGRPDQESFGGIEMTVRRNAFGRQVDSFEAPVRVDGVPGQPFPAVFIRAPWVERVGPAVEVLARVDAALDGSAVDGAPVGGAGVDGAPVGGAGLGGAPAPVGGAGVDGAPVGGAALGGSVVGGPGAHPGPGGSAAGGRPGRIVAVRQDSLLATAFHPELTGDLRLHRLFVEMVRAAGR